MLLVSAPGFTPAQLRICVNTTLTLHPWWVLRLLLSRCLVKEQQEKLNESNKHDSWWRQNFGITTKAGGKQHYSLITFSSLISVSHENKCHLPSYLSPTTTRKSKKRSRRKQTTILLPNIPVMKIFESWLLRCQLKAEKMTQYPCHVSRKCSNVQVAYIKSKEFKVWDISRRKSIG